MKSLEREIRLTRRRDGGRGFVWTLDRGSSVRALRLADERRSRIWIVARRTGRRRQTLLDWVGPKELTDGVHQRSPLSGERAGAVGGDARVQRARPRRIDRHAQTVLVHCRQEELGDMVRRPRRRNASTPSVVVCARAVDEMISAAAASVTRRRIIAAPPRESRRCGRALSALPTRLRRSRRTAPARCGRRPVQPAATAKETSADWVRT